MRERVRAEIAIAQYLGCSWRELEVLPCYVVDEAVTMMHEEADKMTTLTSRRRR